GQERQRQEQQTETDHDVECTLQELVERTAAKAVGVEEPTGSERLEVDSPGLTFPKIQEIDYLDAGELAMQELANRYTAPIVGSHHDLARTQSIHHRRQGIICQESGPGNRLVVRIGTYSRTFAGRPDERDWHEMFVFSGFDQFGDTSRLCS